MERRQYNFPLISLSLTIVGPTTPYFIHTEDLQMGLACTCKFFVQQFIAYSLRNGIRSRSGLQRLQRKGSRPNRSIVFWTGLPCIIAQQTAKIAQHGELNRRPPASSASGHAALANGPSRRCCLQCTHYHIYYGQTWKNYP